MTKSIAYVGALAAALLVASAGTAAAQSSDPADTGSIPGSAAADGENGTGAERGSGAGAEDGETGQLGELGELLPGSVTGSLPGYASGPLGSAATFACNVGSAAGLAANAIGAPLQVPVGVICAVLNPRCTVRRRPAGRRRRRIGQRCPQRSAARGRLVGGSARHLVGHRVGQGIGGRAARLADRDVVVACELSRDGESPRRTAAAAPTGPAAVRPAGRGRRSPARRAAGPSAARPRRDGRTR